MIQNRCKAIWTKYHNGLKDLAEMGVFSTPEILDYATNNAYMFYLVCRSLEERSALIKYLKEYGILSVFYYLALHMSDYYTQYCTDRPELPMCDHYTNCLVRLPMYYELSDEEIEQIVGAIHDFYGK